MKKTLFFLGCLALLAAGCNKVQQVEEPKEVVPELRFNITANYDAETRAVKRAWAEGDKIYIAFDIAFVDYVTDPATGAHYSANHSVVAMTYSTDEGWVASMPDTEFENALRAMGAGKLAAIYISGGQTPEFQFEKSGMVSYLSVANGDELGGYFLSANEASYTVSNNTLSAELSMTLASKEGTYRYPVHFFLPSISADRVSDYTLSSPKIGPDVFLNFNFLPGTYGPVVGRTQENSYGDPIRGSYYAGGLEFVGFVDPDWAGYQTEFVLLVTDNRGTPADDSDDITYHLPKTTTLSGLEAIKLPGLFSGRWTRNPEIGDDDYSFDDLSITVTGFNDMVTW